MRGVPANFRDFVIQFEGEKMDVYDDPAGIPTIYIGHKCLPGEVYLHTILDSAQYLAHDAADAFEAVDSLTHGAANDNEYFAMGDFAFNVGIGAFKGSTLLKLFNAGDKHGASLEFPKWNKTNIKGVETVMAGLTRRRIAEQAIFLKPV